MKKQHHLIVVPGLGGVHWGFQKMTDSWQKYGFLVLVHDVGWKNDEVDFQPKLQRLVHLIDLLYKHDNKVSLMGTSAGGSAVLNAFFERSDKVHRIVNVCGRLRAGSHVFPSLSLAASKSPAFKESVLSSQNKQSSFTEAERNKILTVRGMFDELVPQSTTTIEGATNIRLLTIGHMLSIVAAMTICNNPIIAFLKEDV